MTRQISTFTRRQTPTTLPLSSGPLQRHFKNRSGSSEVPPIMHEGPRSPEQALDPKARSFIESHFGHDFSQVQVYSDTNAVPGIFSLGINQHDVTSVPTGPVQTVAIQAHRIGPDVEDPIHGPLLKSFRESLSQVPGAPQLPDAALKYSGVLGRAGSARWATPTLNRRNLARVWFTSQVLMGNPLGLTTPVINGQPIESNLDVMQAIPIPQINSRTEGGRTRCWFARGVRAVGRTMMDILTPGPWTHVASKTDTATRLAREAQTVRGLLRRLAPCRTGSGDVTVRVTGFRGDAAMEEYIRRGEAEHDTDMQQSFERNIGQYVGNVNALIGGRPELELSGSNETQCRQRLLVPDVTLVDVTIPM